MKNENLNIVIVSNEAWGDIWFSKHHYAHELSKSNQVWFIDPPGKWSPLNLFKSEISSRKINDNLNVISYSNFLPYKFFKLNNKVVSARLNNFFKKRNKTIDIFWSFDPLRLYEPKLLNARFSIFHAVDKYLFQFPTEILLHQNADVFVVVAEEFKEQYTKYNKPILFVPHGIPSGESILNHNTEILPEDYTLYMGMIDIRLDYHFIKKMALRFPEEKFLFLGDIKNVSDDIFEEIFIHKKFPNIIHHPAVHALKLKYFVDNSKCCLAPMNKEWAGNMISHHKILQYMASGKAVFSPEFSAYKSFSDLLYMNNNNDELLNKMQNFYSSGEDEQLMHKRLNYVQNQSYNSHISKIIEFINSEIEG